MIFVKDGIAAGIEALLQHAEDALSGARETGKVLCNRKNKIYRGATADPVYRAQSVAVLECQRPRQLILSEVRNNRSPADSGEVHIHGKVNVLS